MLSIQPERTLVKAGETLKVRVALSGLANVLYGVSFYLNYPTNALWLADATAHRVGAIVPDNAPVVWNVAPKAYATQAGDVAMGASSGTPWALPNGAVAAFVFQVRPGVATQASWPFPQA